MKLKSPFLFDLTSLKSRTSFISPSFLVFSLQSVHYGPYFCIIWNLVWGKKGFQFIRENIMHIIEQVFTEHAQGGGEEVGWAIKFSQR